MKLMVPFTPHLAYECLEHLKCKNPDKWPDINANFEENIKFAVQVNGKTRDIITLKKIQEKRKWKGILMKNLKQKNL